MWSERRASHSSFRSEKGVSDETFALFLNQYRYDATPLNATIEETLDEEDYVRGKRVVVGPLGVRPVPAPRAAPDRGRGREPA